jgi:hypothetical protein
MYGMLMIRKINPFFILVIPGLLNIALGRAGRARNWAGLKYDQKRIDKAMDLINIMGTWVGGVSIGFSAWSFSLGYNKMGTAALVSGLAFNYFVFKDAIK